MPSMWNKPWSCAAAGGVALSRLVAGRRRGSLPVQTGFPTSLADLFVKNRNRLKKPSRKKKPSADTGFSSSPLSAAASSWPTPPTNAGTSTRILSDDRRGVPVVVVQSDSGSGSSRDAEIRFPTLEIFGAREKSGIRIGFTMSFRVILVNLLISMFLAMESKTLVAGVTVFALGLWLLDSLGVQVFGFLKPCFDAQRSLNSVIRRTELEKRAHVWPIRESSNCPDLIQYERSSVEPILLHQGKNLMPESRDLVRTVDDCAGQVPNSSKNVKPKKFFKKFMIKKLQLKTNDNAQCELSSCPIRRRLSGSISQENEEIQEIEEEEDAQSSEEPLLSAMISDRCVKFDIGNSEVTQECTYKTKSIDSVQLVCLALILIGLLKGKITALILTVYWVGFSKLLESMWKKEDGFSFLMSLYRAF